MSSSSEAKETNVKPLKEMLLEEPELSRLGRQDTLTIYVFIYSSNSFVFFVYMFIVHGLCRIKRTF